jgi:hypothetical protein
MLTFFIYRKLVSNLVMLIARHLLFYGLFNTENVMNEITHLPDSQKKYGLADSTGLTYIHGRRQGLNEVRQRGVWGDISPSGNLGSSQ